MNTIEFPVSCNTPACVTMQPIGQVLITALMSCSLETVETSSFLRLAGNSFVGCKYCLTVISSGETDKIVTT